MSQKIQRQVIMSKPGQPLSFQYIIYFPSTNVDYYDLRDELDNLEGVWLGRIYDRATNLDAVVKHVPAQEVFRPNTLPVEAHTIMVVTRQLEELEWLEVNESKWREEAKEAFEVEDVLQWEVIEL